MFVNSSKVRAASADSASVWGLEDPVALTQLNCFAVLVEVPEMKTRNRSCQVESDRRVNFDLNAGFFSVGEVAELQVPAGENRQFVLIGMASATGECGNRSGRSMSLNQADYSAPFIIGDTRANLSGSEQVVDVPLRSQFDTDHKIVQCDFIAGDGDDADEGEPGDQIIPPTLAFYPSVRKQWVDDNPIPRTVSITHDGTSLECSTDGISFSACPSNTSMVWEVTNYNDEHTLRVNYSDGTNELVTFTPSSEFPGVIFNTCTQEISTASDFNALTALLTPTDTNQIICFSNNLIYDNTDNTQDVDIHANGSKLMVRQGHQATLRHDGSSLDAIDIHPNVSGVQLIGIRLEVYNLPTGGDEIAGLQLLEANLDILLEDTTIIMQGRGSAVSGDDAGTSTNPIRIVHSHLENQSTGVNTLLFEGSSYVEINDSRIDSFDDNIVTEDSARVYVSNSHLVNSGSSNQDRLVATTLVSRITVSNSLLQDGSGGGVAAFGPSRLDMHDNTIQRLASGAPSSALIEHQSILATLNFSNNFVCNMDPSSGYAAHMRNTPTTIPAGYNFDFLPSAIVPLCP